MALPEGVIRPVLEYPAVGQLIDVESIMDSTLRDALKSHKFKRQTNAHIR
jgi:hypothetical protein